MMKFTVNKAEIILSLIGLMTVLWEILSIYNGRFFPCQLENASVL
jgi:hypothetical protein